MANAARTPSGNIYDLGYRAYDGARLGRRYAITSLFNYSLLSIWGIGRSLMAKLFPMGLAVIAMIPALVTLAIAALFTDEFEFLEAYDYFGYVSIILALLCAVAAPDLIGRDQRHHTLALYFSRALDRKDYASAKLMALMLSLFLVLAVPQIIVQLGNAVATDDLTGYLQDNIDLIPPVLGTSVLVAVFMGSLSLAIAIQTSRRAFATGAVIAAFIILTAIGTILLETLDGDARKYSLLISPFGLLEGVVYWMFGVDPPLDSDIDRAGLGGEYYFLAAVVYSAISLAFIYRRIQRMSI